MPRPTCARGLLPMTTLLGVLLGLLAACASPAVHVPPVISPAASAAFVHARTLNDNEDPGALAAAERALALAPQWIAPARLIDDVLLRELLGPRALAAHRAALVHDPNDPRSLYLAGRLEPEERSRELFQRAIALAPRLPWPYHGMAVRSVQVGKLSRAVQYERMALDRAIDPWEAAWFRAQLAGFLDDAGRDDEALRVVREGLTDERLEPPDRVWLRCKLAELELGHRQGEVRERGLRRAVRLVTEEDLPDRVLIGLVRAGSSFQTPRELRSALLARSGEMRGTLLTGALLDLGTSRLAYRAALAGERPARLGDDRDLRLQAFAFGDGARAIEAWREALPVQVLDGKGMPREPRLAHLVRAAVTFNRGRTPGTGRQLGEALLSAGWFAEASAFARDLADLDVDAALDLLRRSEAALDGLSDIGRLVRRMENGRGTFPFLEDERLPRPAGPDEVEMPVDELAAPPNLVRGLDPLMHALGVILTEIEVAQGEVDARSAKERATRLESRESIASSPRIGYWVLGKVVHPGPLFSAQDEKLGRGKEGEEVPGLAASMGRLLRFAVLGTSAGSDAPDAAILRRLWVEERSGEHLGIPWSGTIAWCDGVDLAGRVARHGASIAGAALHEGYYVDFEPLRRSLASWRVLEEEYQGAGAAARVASVLSASPLAVAADAPGSAPHLALGPQLGAVDRLRLTMLLERGDGDPERPLGSMTLDELVDVTERHEEGHLCDRHRFYPPGHGLMTLLFDVVLRGLLAGGQVGVMAELEYRAQLVALCTVDDPRLALVELLSAADGGFGNGVPHGAAYARLLADFLVQLDSLREQEPTSWSQLDPTRLYVQSLHLLTPEQVRVVGLALARKRGLVARGWKEQ